jgi:ribosomal protein S18 acetylase RimI-like enzyme
MNLIQAATEAEIQMARELFEEYAVGIGISLCFQNFDQELAGLPGKYAAPDGRLLLAYSDDRLAGCIALRKLDSISCEMKRLFLRNDFRGQGLGRALVQAIIDEAKGIGYERIRLDTLPGRMDSAISLYRRFGFQEIAPYYDNPVEGALFMELALT